jgi:lipopolysaccharide transport system permease protein
VKCVIIQRNVGTSSLLDPYAFFSNLWRHRNLIGQFARREIDARYRGTNLGLYWSIVNPLILLLIYTFAFGAVFRMRWPNLHNDGLAAFAIVLFCSLWPFNIFSECATRASSLVLAVPNFVKRVVFPLEILAVAQLSSALFHGAISLLVLFAGIWFVFGSVPWTVALLPIVVLPLITLTLGVTWFLSSLGVFLRDVGQAVGLLVQVLLFTTPIFFPMEAVPEQYRAWLWLNPLTWIVEDVRNTMLWGVQPDWSSLAWRIPLGLAAMLGGYVWFMKSKRGFADVI